MVTSYKPAVACFSRELARHKGNNHTPHLLL